MCIFSSLTAPILLLGNVMFVNADKQHFPEGLRTEQAQVCCLVSLNTKAFTSSLAPSLRTPKQ